MLVGGMVVMISSTHFSNAKGQLAIPNITQREEQPSLSGDSEGSTKASPPEDRPDYCMYM